MRRIFQLRFAGASPAGAPPAAGALAAAGLLARAEAVGAPAAGRGGAAGRWDAASTPVRSGRAAGGSEAPRGEVLLRREGLLRPPPEDKVQDEEPCHDAGASVGEWERAESMPEDEELMLWRERVEESR